MRLHLYFIGLLLLLHGSSIGQGKPMHGDQPEDIVFDQPGKNGGVPYGHSLDGAVAILGLLPSEHFGIYIFGNLDHSEVRHALMYKAMDLWGFHDNSRDWSTDFYALYKGLKDEARKKEKEKEASRLPNARPSLPLASYAGRYTNETYGDAVISLANDTLVMLLPNAIRMKLKPWNYDTFEGDFDYGWWDKSTVSFMLNSDGKVSAFDKDGVEYTRFR